MLLFLDTTQDNITIALRLTKSDGDFLITQKKIVAQFQEAEKLLPTINNFLQLQQVRVGDLQGIAVVAGPGHSFTSLRLGLAVANTLGYGLDIPVQAVKSLADLSKIKIAKNEKFKKLVLPAYGREPNITNNE